ncbi:hypothetical protein [Streptomyces sp. Qhu_M48]|uniref:hypothetical protein n=1 Tax=Streptomyces sp. Qhu_M48 TaxID=3435889 RepID=UPI003F4FA86E
MRSARLRRPVLAAFLALLATGCGGSDAGKGEAAAGGEKATATAAAAGRETASATPAAGETMSSDRHLESLLTEEDLPGYRGFRDVDSEGLPASALAADKPVCKPLADALDSVPSGATYVVRQLLTPPSGKVRTVVAVSTYQGTAAERWLTDLKAAVAPCAAGFKATEGTDRTTYTDVVAEPLDAGDEALAWSATVTKGGVSVPVRLAVVRKKNNVALFFTYDAEGRAVGRQPKDLVDAQVVKLP